MTGMSAEMRNAVSEFEELLESDRITAGMYVRARGDSLIAGRWDTSSPDKAPQADDRVRLTRLGRSAWGLSVKRHTGRWERTPFSGSMAEMVEVMHTLMQHLVAS